MLQYFDQIDHFGRLRRFLRFLFNFFSAGLDFFFDHFHQRFFVVVFIFFGIPLRAHAVDQRRRHIHFAFSDFNFFWNIELRRIGELVGEMHQLEHERAVLWFHAREILARFDHDFGDADLFLLLEGIAQQCVRLIAAFLRL